MKPETPRQSSRGDCWTPENFPNNFGFIKQDQRLFKEIRGQRYSFCQVRSADGLLKIVDIQKLAWGWADADLAPTHILSLMEDTGGGVFGAYNENEEMIAFAAGFGGGKDVPSGRPAIISSMLAVAGENFRSSGIGKELKLIQAHYALMNGYEVMKWFYDPERAENASLNLRKLGARAEEFWINKYGQMHSQLYGPVPTDRFRAVWRYTEQSTIDRITGISQAPTVDQTKEIPIASLENMPDSNKVLIQISPNIDAESDQNKIERRFKQRKIFSHYFLDRDYIATEFITGSDPKGKRVNYYLLEPLSLLPDQQNLSRQTLTS